MFLCSMRMTRVRSGFHTCRTLLISRLPGSSESLEWPSTSCQLLYNITRFWLRNKASLEIPKTTFFLWDALIEAKNMPQGVFYFSLLWSQLIIPYTGSCLYISLLIVNNYKYSRIAHLHAVTIKLMCFFLSFCPLANKIQLASHKYSCLINFSMHSKRI